MGASLTDGPLLTDAAGDDLTDAAEEGAKVLLF